MKSSTRRRALDSAAKIALGCCLGAVSSACGGLSQDGGSTRATDLDGSGGPPAPSASATTEQPAPSASATTEPSPPAPTASATTEPSPPPEPEPVLACLAAVNVEKGALTTTVGAEERACCESYVETAVNAGQVWTGENGQADPSVLNCCRLLAYVGNFDASVAHNACCAVPGQLLSVEDYWAPYCSPWGPPVPPALVIA